MVLILARHSREGGVVAHGCAVNESKDGEVVHGCTVNGAKDANPLRQITIYSLDPRPPPTRGQAPNSGGDDKNVIWLQTIK